MTTPEIVPMIIPTVMIPLTLVSVGISVVASFIAALFGIELKLEGPRKLLEVLLKPKVLATAFFLNAIVMGGIYGWKWWTNYPRLISTIESEMKGRAKSSDITYSDVPTVRTNFKASFSSAKVPSQLEEVWRIDTRAGAFRAAVVSNGRVFSGNDDGIITEADLLTGKVIRSFYIGTPASSEISIWNNKLFVGEGRHDTHHARIYRFDLKSGKFTGSYQTLGHTEAQAIVASFENQHLLFIVAGVDGLHAVDPETMEMKWQANFGHMDAAVLTDDEGHVFAGSGREKHDDKKYKSYAMSFDFKTGKELWKQELPASSWMRPVFVGTNVCFITGEIYFPSGRGHLVCFDKKSGDHTVAFNTPEPIASTPKVIDQTVLFATITGKICRFDVEKRSLQWCTETEASGTTLAGASYDPNTHLVVYPAMTKGLFVLDPDTGEILMQWNPKDPKDKWGRIYGDVSVSADRWIVSDNDGLVRALKPQFFQKTADNK